MEPLELCMPLSILYTCRYYHCCHYDAIINNYAYNVIHFPDSIYRESLTAVSEARPRPS